MKAMQLEGRDDRCFATDVAARVRELTGGQGADIVFNTVGDPIFRGGASIARRARPPDSIAAVGRIVQFDILEFYRGQHTYVGIDTLAFSSSSPGRCCGNWGRVLRAGISNRFDQGECDLSLEQAKAAFVAVAGSSRDRVICGGREERTHVRPPTSSCSPVSSSARLRRGRLLSGFCMMRACVAGGRGDGRLVRTYALAMGVTLQASQLLAASGLVDLGSRSICSRISAPMMFRRCCSATACDVERLRLARADCSAAATCVPSWSWSCWRSLRR